MTGPLAHLRPPRGEGQLSLPGLMMDISPEL